MRLHKLIHRIAACALALSLFLLPNISTARAEGKMLLDADGNGSLNEQDVRVFLRAAAGFEGLDTSHVAGFARAGQAAALSRYLGGMEQSALAVSRSGMNSADTVAAVRAYIAELMTADLKDCIDRLPKSTTKTYDRLAKAKPIFAEMADTVNAAAEKAVRDCAETLRAELADANAVVLPAKPPQKQFQWKEIAGLYRAYGDSLSEMIAASAVISVAETGEAVYSVGLEFPFFDDIAAQGTRQQLITARSALCYLNTVYDNEGVFHEYETYPLSDEYLSTIIHPLYGQFLIKNGWFDPRSHGTRRHMGTDITAPARTKIHSVTDGIVLFIGYADTPGNYVIIRDPYGFEYHYYHMVEQSKSVKEGDIVRQGDVIGLVGNTGNSDANHLHIAVVSPENTYINPYDMYLAAGITPIRIDE